MPITSQGQLVEAISHTIILPVSHSIRLLNDYLEGPLTIRSSNGTSAIIVADGQQLRQCVIMANPDGSLSTQFLNNALASTWSHGDSDLLPLNGYDSDDNTDLLGACSSDSELEN